MTGTERQKCVDAIRERVERILCPLGIVVGCELVPPGRLDVAAFTFKIPDTNESKPGTFQEVIIHLTNGDVVQCHTDPAQLDCLSRAWARICAEWAPTLFAESNLPEIGCVDWRPQETLPEDFYAV